MLFPDQKPLIDPRGLAITFCDFLVRRSCFSSSFYIMLSGQTSVYIDTLKSDNENNSILTAAMNVDVNIDVTEDPSAEVNLEEDGSAADGKKKKQLDRSKYGKFIIHFGKFLDFLQCANSFQLTLPLLIHGGSFFVSLVRKSSLLLLFFFTPFPA